MFNFLVGMDIGQVVDYTAIVILERKERIEPDGVSIEDFKPRLNEQVVRVNHYELRHIERLKLGTTYFDIVRRLQTLLRASELQTQTMVLVDQTGCGRPVVEMMRREGIRNLVGITITGGNSVTETEDGYHVPKKELVASLQVYLQSGRLKIAEALPLATTLRDEALNFKVKVNLGSTETFEAWREGKHDDLVLATSLTCWYAQLYDSRRRVIPDESKVEPYDPMNW